MKPLKPVGLVLEGALDLRVAADAVAYCADHTDDEWLRAYDEVATLLDGIASIEEHTPSPRGQVVEYRFPEEIGAAVVLSALRETAATHRNELTRQAAGAMIAEI